MEWININLNIGKKGSEDGKIVFEKTLSDQARITIEQVYNHKYNFVLIIGVKGYIVDTAFFGNLDDAKETVYLLENIIQCWLENK